MGVAQGGQQSSSQSLRDALHALGLLEWEERLHTAGVRTMGHIAHMSSPDELPIQLPGAARRELLNTAKRPPPAVGGIAVTDGQLVQLSGPRAVLSLPACCRPQREPQVVAAHEQQSFDQQQAEMISISCQ